jgi:hypothetical protein
MRTIKQVRIETIVEVEFMPTRDTMEFGKLYHSKRFNSTSHLCLCGCGVECYLPLGADDWKLFIDGKGRPTLTPSILQRFDCKSHYIITNGLANFV